LIKTRNGLIRLSIIIEINSGSDRLEKLANKITQKILPQKKIPPCSGAWNKR